MAEREIEMHVGDRKASRRVDRLLARIAELEAEVMAERSAMLSMYDEISAARDEREQALREERQLKAEVERLRNRLLGAAQAADALKERVERLSRRPDLAPEQSAVAATAIDMWLPSHALWGSPLTYDQFFAALRAAAEQVPADTGEGR